ncbi:MAG: stage II sporulation protein M [Nanoarchaeota archaeon]|nr:stage II sporulation protein M [Nanoarchaeota archaeon]
MKKREKYVKRKKSHVKKHNSSRLIKKSGGVETGNYSKCWDYLKESRNYFYFILFLFFVSGFIGFLFPVFFIDFIKEFVKDLLELTKGMGFFRLLIFILQNNIMTSFFGMIFGLFFGIIPLILCCLNGYVLGFISRAAVELSGFSVLLKLFPHGIFEIPALILSLGLGLKLGMFIFTKNLKKEKLIYDLKNSVRVFLFVIIPLLVIAGIIETLFIFVG